MAHRFVVCSNAGGRFVDTLNRAAALRNLWFWPVSNSKSCVLFFNNPLLKIRLLVLKPLLLSLGQVLV